MNIDAIILSNSKELVHYGLTCRTINSLRNSDKYNDIKKIIVVESQNILNFQQSGYMYPDCCIVHPDKKFGYNKFLNIGLKHSTSDWILICNNDLFFTNNWLEKAKDVINKYPNIKSFSPICPNWYLHQGINDDITIGYTVSKEICGWCILLHRSIITNYDLFDEQFEFWYQDNDYAMVLQSNNELHGLMGQSKVYHMVSASHNLMDENLRNEMTYGQQQKFINKWKSSIH